MKKHSLERTVFKMARSMEYFSERELTMQTGLPKSKWFLMILSELIDNAIDETEKSIDQPKIEIKITKDYLEVKDNGLGIKSETIKESLNYSSRISEKASYLSPTRGQLGNALKIIWAAPLVATNEGRFEVEARGMIHHINISIDRIKQEPIIYHNTDKIKPVKSGTIFRVFWSDLSRSFQFSENNDSYVNNHLDLISAFSLFNPHLILHLNDREFKATKSSWKKWSTDDPTSINWYNLNEFRDLIAAYLSHEKNSKSRKTIRSFISEFHGLKGTQKQKEVMKNSKLIYLDELKLENELDLVQIQELLDQMKKLSLTISPHKLGIIGKEHIENWISHNLDIIDNSFSYSKLAGIDSDDLPFVFEVAIAWKTDTKSRRTLITGLNWSPLINNKMSDAINLGLILSDINYDDPVYIVFHIVKPRFEYSDKGKSTIILSKELLKSICSSFKNVTQKWVTEKKRRKRLDSKGYNHSNLSINNPNISQKDIAFEIMEEAYNHASNFGKYSANARQIYYAARPMILKRSSVEKVDSRYFTQTLLKDYLEDPNTNTKAWKVVWDARGHFYEPHHGISVNLGGVGVSNYLDSFSSPKIINPTCNTIYGVTFNGPKDNYKNVLYIEKEGFNEIFNDAKIADQYDLAIMSSKGIPVKAVCDLLQGLDRYVRVFVLHDFDKAGFKILKTLRNGTRLAKGIKVIDLGLRLNDIKSLPSEPVSESGTLDGNIKYLLKCGATKKECQFLIEKVQNKKCKGRRVELNAMTSEEFITWLQVKFKYYNVQKVIPMEEDRLANTYMNIQKGLSLDDEIQKLVKTINISESIKPPPDLREKITAFLEQNPTSTWYDAIKIIVKSERSKEDSNG